MQKQELQPPIAGIRTTIHVPRVRRAVERVLGRIQAVDPGAHSRITQRLWGIFWLTEEFRFEDREGSLDSPHCWVWGRTLIFPASAPSPPALKPALKEGPLDPSAIGWAKTLSGLIRLFGGFADDLGGWVLLSPYVVHLRSRFLHALIAHELGHVATTQEEVDATDAELHNFPLTLEKCANSYLDRWFFGISDVLAECHRVGLLGEEPESLLFLRPEEFDASKALRGRPPDWPSKLRRHIQALNRRNRRALRDFRRATSHPPSL